ncbi:MAG TPA: BMP family ABC transporter substrate-binding protein, partial [Rectinemataceae bacterium]|nr:BMP family ABC transporter substrate-binding protein [Rectinemataceae bacterium]
GGIDDKSFNQGTWEGVKAYAAERGLKIGTDVKYLQSTADADYIPNLSTFADQKMDLIIAPGFLFNEAMLTVAQQYPNQKFMIIDSVVQDKAGKNVANVANAVFAANEGSFLAGVAAGLKAKADKKDTIGFVGGMQFPLIENFQVGFEQGVKAVFPNAKILVDYTGSFTDAGIGQAMAAKQYNAGADIIYQVAGGSGNGVIKEAKERSAKGDIRWAIGVDKDQYADGVYAPGKSAVLTSMMKRVDVAAKDVSEMTEAGKFPGGTVLVFDLKSKGVGLPAKNPNLSAAIEREIAKYTQLIVTGKLKVDSRG